jgi:hypothetical protein
MSTNDGNATECDQRSINRDLWARYLVSKLGIQPVSPTTADLLSIIPSSDTADVSFLTDSKIRQKQIAGEYKANESIKPVKKKKQHVYDPGVRNDCGDDLDGISKYEVLQTSAFSCESDSDWESVAASDGDHTCESFFDNSYWFAGCDANYLAFRHLVECTVFNCFLFVAKYTDTLPQGNVFCEIAGGAAHTTRILVQHAVPCGPNFDLVCRMRLHKA